MKNRLHVSQEIIVITLTLFTNIVAFLRDSIISNYFGLSVKSDVFYLATTIPNILITWVSAALSTALIPIILKHKVDSEEEKNESLFWWICKWSFILTIVISLMGKFIINIMAPNYSGDEKGITSLLFSISSLIIFPSCVSSFFTSVSFVSNKTKSQIVFQLINNLFVVLLTIGLVGFFHMDLFGAVIAIVLANYLQTIIFFVVILKQKVFNLSFKSQKARSRDILFKVSAIFIANSVAFLNMLINRALSTLVDVGSVTALNFASKIYSMPVNLLTTSVIMIFFTDLSKLKVNSLEFKQKVKKSLMNLVLIFIPIEFLLIMESNKIVSILYGYGRFSAQDISMTGATLRILSFSLVFAALQVALIKVYSLYKVKFNILVGFIAIIVNLISSVLLINSYGVYGIAFSNSLSVVVQVVILMGRLNLKFTNFINLIKIFSQILLMSAITFTLFQLKLFEPSGSGKLSVMGNLIIVGGIYGMFTLPFLYFLSLREN